MNGFGLNLERETLSNDNFRRVLFTAPHSQLVLMSLLPNEEIGMETHAEHDQFIKIEAGNGQAMIGGQEFVLEPGSAVVIPAGSEHNIINTSPTEKMKLYTVYTPPEHPDGTIHATRPAA